MLGGVRVGQRRWRYGQREHAGDERVPDETATVDCGADLRTLTYFGRLRRRREEIAVTTQPTQVILINGFGVLFVIFNAFGLGLRLPIGKLLAQAVAHWQIAVWVLVINFVIIPLLFIGYLLTIASSIPDEVKIGFCIAALSAGMPFAPLLAQLGKANVSISTTLLVILTVATIIALPLGLPLATAVVDVQLKVSIWDTAWPLLLFLLLPLALGCGFRVWWPDLASSLRQWVVRIAILCLLLNLNFTIFVYWDLFVQTWGTGSYLAALAGPFIGLGCGYLLVSGLRVHDVGTRHAAEITTAVRNIGPMLLMMIFPFVAYPLVTVSITILNTIGLVVVILFVLVWRRALSPQGVKAGTAAASLPGETLSQPSSGEATA
jgi:BASS family bile acid:Na+ symporter